MVTTNEIEIKKAGKPEKLTVLTTAKIPGPTAQPPMVEWDPSKMITTHDDNPIDLGVDNHAEIDIDEGVILRKKAGGPKRVK